MCQASARQVDGTKTLEPNGIGNSSRSPIPMSTDAPCLSPWEECLAEDRALTSWPGHADIRTIGISSQRSPAMRRGTTNRCWRSTAILKIGTEHRTRNSAEPEDQYLSNPRKIQIQ